MTIAHANYRPDIDGLRAFAVISVVVFHAFPSLLPGGFVGVDIFFVISGFLISGIIFESLNQGRFGFLNFYAKRITRIFPALIVVLCTTFALAWFVLFDDELDQLGKHLSRAAAFLSNLILWHESGYFDNVAETKPLLHLWSLSIEEQFYIVWPVLVWLLWRVKAWRLQLVVTLSLLSLGWNLYLSQHDLTQDFYSPLTRFWELLSGAILALQAREMRQNNAKYHAGWTQTPDVRSGLGAAALLAAIVFIDGSQKFPGAWALLPVAGAVLVISGDRQSWINRVVLSHPMVVWTGTISYPLYLWHWPIFSFARIVEGGTPSGIVRFAGLVLSIALAWVTFRYIERPIRFVWAFRYKPLVLALGMLCVGALGYFTHKQNGYPKRTVMAEHNIFKAGDIGHDEFHRYHSDHFFTCEAPDIQKDANEWKGILRCFQSHQNAPVTLLLLGDSHAEHLFLGIAEQLPQVNVGFYGKSGLPLLSKQEFKVIFNHVLKNTDIKQVVISGAWATWMNELRNGEDLTAELGHVVEALEVSGKKVYLSDDIAQFEFDPQRCKFQRPLSQSTKCDEPISRYQSQREKYMSELDRVTKAHPSVGWIDLSGLLCTSILCSMARNGQVLYRDNNHLNIPGSQYIGQKIVEQQPTLGR